jgi:hypothetical protein
VVACILAMLAMPTFDVFPLGHHRVAGLLGLLLLTAPRALASKGSSGTISATPPSSRALPSSR